MSDELLLRLLEPGADCGVLRDRGLRDDLLRRTERHGAAALAALAWSPWLADLGMMPQRAVAANWALLNDRLALLREVLRVTESAGIEILCLKGPVLASRFYDPPSLRRPSVDLDFAVRTRDIPRAVQALSALSYAAEPLDKALRCNHHVTLDSPGKIPLELHFRLSHGSAGIPVDEFFGRAARVTLPDGQSVLALSEADQLLHLLLHTGGQSHPTLFHLLELRRVIRASGHQVLENAIRRAASAHFSGLLQVLDQSYRHYYGDTLIPAGVRLTATWLSALRGPEFHQRLRPRPGDGGKRDVLRWFRLRWLDICMTDTPGDAARLFWRMTLSAWYQLKRALGR